METLVIFILVYIQMCVDAERKCGKREKAKSFFFFLYALNQKFMRSCAASIDACLTEEHFATDPGLCLNWASQAIIVSG